MFRRLGVAVIAVMFALGVFAGMVSGPAMASPMSASCYQVVDHMSVDHRFPANNGDHSAAHVACVVTVSCAAFVLPMPTTVPRNVKTLGWHVSPPSGLEGASRSPETPPPITSL